MTFELRDNSGSAFKNRKKEAGDNKPDFTGEMKVNGELYWLSVWQKKDKNGNVWLSHSLMEKKAEAVKEAAAKDMDDDIPF